MAMTPEAIRQGRPSVDFINVGSLLSDEEKAIQDRVRSYVDREVIPTAAQYWDKAEFPFDLLRSLGELGIVAAPSARSREGRYGRAGRREGRVSRR
jgi:glutaryl-CoA dehydrogenase